MTTRTVPRSEWRTFFDGVAHAVIGKRVEVEAASLEIGDQIVTDWVPLLGITYDSQDDLLDIALTGLNHLIRQPREIQVQEGPGGLQTIAVVSADGAKRILHLKDPLMLAAAGPSAR